MLSGNLAFTQDTFTVTLLKNSSLQILKEYEIKLIFTLF